MTSRFHLLWGALAGLLLVISGPAFGQEAAAACPPGQVQNADTAGNCCWPGQAWSGTQCVGRPTACLSGFTFSQDGQQCELLVCGGGRVRTADGVHCCWPGQGWSSARRECVGTPRRCPDKYVIEDNECVEGPYLTDSDGDGIPDALDKCPYVPEPHDGYQNGDGCPQLDVDFDGIPNHLDNCPDQPMVYFTGAPEDGCPVLDRDGDGVPDIDDLCPDVPGDPDDPKSDGCPRDDDGDGIPNVDDLCPADPEDIDGFEDGDGCPDYDNDGDGIPDFWDACPNVAADHIPGMDTNGCPLADSDGDGVADAFDLCPGQMEDGLGRFPDDGCPLPFDERLAARRFGNGGRAITLLSGVHLLPTPNDDLRAVPLGIEYHGRRGVIGVSGAVPQLGPLLLEAHTGIYLLSWPQHRFTDFSLINPIIGAHVTMNDHGHRSSSNTEFSSTGAGLWMRQDVTLGPVRVGVEYRGYQIFGSFDGDYDDDFRQEAIYSLVFGWDFGRSTPEAL